MKLFNRCSGETLKPGTINPVEFYTKLTESARPEVTLPEIFETLQSFSGFSEVSQYRQVNRIIWKQQETGFLERRELFKLVAHCHNETHPEVAQSVWFAEMIENKLGETWQELFWQLQSQWMLQFKELSLERILTISEFLRLFPNYQHDIVITSLIRKLRARKPSLQALNICSNLNHPDKSIQRQILGFKQNLIKQLGYKALWPYAFDPNDISQQPLYHPEQIEVLEKYFLTNKVDLQSTQVVQLRNILQNFQSCFLYQVCNLILENQPPPYSVTGWKELTIIGNLSQQHDEFISERICSRKYSIPIYFKEIQGALTMYHVTSPIIQKKLIQCLGQYKTLVGRS